MKIYKITFRVPQEEVETLSYGADNTLEAERAFLDEMIERYNVDFVDSIEIIDIKRI